MLDQIIYLRKNIFIRFLVAGIANTIFSLIVYSICIIAGLAVWQALLTSMLSGTIFNFFTTGRYVFRELSSTRLPRFVVCQMFVYFINLLLMELLTNWPNSKIVSQAIIAFPLSMVSYFLMKRFVFIGACINKK